MTLLPAVLEADSRSRHSVSTALGEVPAGLRVRRQVVGGLLQGPVPALDAFLALRAQRDPGDTFLTSYWRDRFGLWQGAASAPGASGPKRLPIVPWRRRGESRGAEMSESIELATILLTDLVGSTRLATTVGPAVADALREEHFGVLREAIALVRWAGGEEHGRRPDGRVLLRLGGGPLCSVDSAAVRAALPPRRRIALHVRIGMGAGESTVKDGDYFGMPSIEAARLCDAGAPGWDSRLRARDSARRPCRGDVSSSRSASSS